MSVRLFVGNLPYDVTENEIREFFAPVGRLSRIFLPLDRETGKQRGFAFIEFGSQNEADDAIRRMNSQSFKGRPIAVKEARERENRAPGGNGSYPSRPSTGPRPPARPAPRPLGGSGTFPAPRAGDELGAPPRRRSFGPAARPDRKRRPQQNKPHKSEWGKKAFKRERLREDDEEDLSLYTAGTGVNYDAEVDEQEVDLQDVEEQDLDSQDLDDQDPEAVGTEDELEDEETGNR